ncbi:MAG: adenylate/guanylate cyclase domain-containing protein [Saprospiraceae bacterium]|nr:adenylate/guanylate cyclase domain-containing protein [Saprospiraceae bacterium]
MNWAQKVRLRAKIIMYTGWILFFYAVTHLINHSIGIFGLDSLEKARLVFVGFWRLPVFEWLIVLCLFLHLFAVLHKLFNKTTFKGLSSAEWVQIVLGLLIPDLMVHHVMSTKIAGKLFNVSDSYSHYIYWTPDYMPILFLLMIIIVWTHGTIGIRSFIRQKPWYRKWRPWISGLAVGLPILAAWGTTEAVQAVDRLSRDPEWVETLVANSNPRGIDLYAWEESWSYTFTGAYVLFILLFFLTRKLVLYIKKKQKGIRIKYLEGTEVTITKGASLLEASLQANIPHAHVCGGRGRCSTCRVQVIEGLDQLPPPSNDERELLEKIKGGNAVRLACRTRPNGACTIYPLLLPNVTLNQSLWRSTSNTGVDADVAVLFADLRGFTAFAEDKLPFDVVYILNQYFQFMGHAIETHHGKIDKFIGDAIMAVFGVERNLPDACRDAIAAARSMRFQLDRLNDQLKHQLTEPLRIGFGIHCGHVIIGEMGYKEFSNLVAIGDATNTASRLESLTKDFGCELVVSREVVDRAGLDFSQYTLKKVDIRGRQKQMEVYMIPAVADMDVEYLAGQTISSN